MNFSVFNTESWQMLNDSERKAALQELENTAAQAQGRQARTLVTTDQLDANTYGQYDPVTSSWLFINEDLLNADAPGSQYQIMETLLHEGRHAYQDDYKNGLLPASSSDPEQGELWDKNFKSDVYLDPQNPQYRFFTSNNSWEAYYVQPIEDDAESYATDCMNNLQNVYSYDPYYGQYLSYMNAEREAALERASALLGDNPQGRISDLIENRYSANHADELPYKASSNELDKEQQSPDDLPESHADDLSAQVTKDDPIDYLYAPAANTSDTYEQLNDSEKQESREKGNNLDFLYSAPSNSSDSEENTSGQSKAQTEENTL